MYDQVRLWPADLREIESILQSAKSDRGKLTIKTDKFEGDTIDEIVDAETRFKVKSITFSLSDRLENVYLRVTGFGGRLSVTGGNNDAFGAAAFRIQTIMQSSQRPEWVRSLLNPYFLGSLAALIALAAQDWGGAGFFPIFGVTFTILISVFNYFTLRGSAVYMQERPTRPSFWRRNSDRIVVGAIIAVVSSLLTLLVSGLTT
ncbi:hypothetical protein GCM10011354_23000 [Egicoccus halophilus]|uniref:Uncharacterized protein n=2 Tax=Egicoccus halophilus TaxID=1670830 RepID=A0A8J3AB37_9ACTN|nr:hypothetical protein GCM10011354_23000 [Egicoccus halophilus]